MAVMKLQLNTPAEITRDLKVEVINTVTNRVVDTAPYLDGTVNVRNLAAGNYRLKVKHPHIPFDVLDRPVRVFEGRPTFVPLKIDLEIFSNTPVRDIAEVDLQPVREALQTAADTAEKHAAKRGGEPIFADDWNELANSMGGLADATTDLTRRVSAHGHDHPELIEKMDEIQGNLQRFLDVFGQSMAQVQRQLQQLALRSRADSALDRIGEPTPAQRQEVDRIVRDLEGVRRDNPYVYTTHLKRAGEAITALITDAIPDDQPELRDAPEVQELAVAAQAMAQAQPAQSYEAEVKHHLAVDKRSSGNLDGVFRRLQR